MRTLCSIIFKKLRSFRITASIVNFGLPDVNILISAAKFSLPSFSDPAVSVSSTSFFKSIHRATL